MNTLQFKVARVNQRQQAKRVTFDLEDKPTGADFKNELIDQLGIEIPKSESLRVTNLTSKKEIVDELPLSEQVNLEDELVYETDGVAGNRGDI
ncbi:hypothetical protein JXO59_05385 [candidate division KSB1 bacterium]|nr:hypothetical protein [candidate division KSB1 bacterium]